MLFRKRKIICTILIIALLWGRVLSDISIVFALDAPPSVPSIPNNTNSSVPPPPPPPPLNSIPELPSAPPPPPMGGQNNNIPTLAPPPTNPPLPTEGSSLPTTPPLPTGESQATITDNQSLPTETPPDNTLATITEEPTLTPDSPYTTGGESSGGSSSDSYSSGSVNDPANINTGPSSQNEAYENLNKKLEVMNQNLAELQNKIDAISTTGFNYANFNTMDGQVFTGEALSSINLLNKLNSNVSGTGEFSVFNIYGNYLNDIIFQLADGNSLGSFASASPTVSKNTTTGPNSTNIASADNSFTVKEANGNDAKLGNDIFLQAVSGGNSASFNTGSGNITTGNATAIGNVINMSNTNLSVAKWLIGVVNIFGTMAGNIILPQETGNTTSLTTPVVKVDNQNTGPASFNSANYENTSTTNYENQNTAEITSTLDTSANSGENISSANTGGGFIQTGDTDVSISNSTIANSNTVKEEETVWMIIVNEAGKWVGHILGAPWGDTYSSNSLPLTQTTGGSPSGVVDSFNSNTGPLSYNESSYTNNETTDITNNNTAAITNNITASSDTGNNTSIYNTGAGNIQTGDAKVALNLVNMANTNVVAKKFIAVLVNVLGKFLGDIIPPNQNNYQTDSITDSSTTNQTENISEGDNTDNTATQNQINNNPTPTPTVVDNFNSNSAGSNHQGGPRDVVVSPTLSPTPTVEENREEIDSNQQQHSGNQANSSTNQSWFNSTQYYNYLRYLAYLRQQMSLKKAQIKQNVPTQPVISSKIKTAQRGLFLSPAFAKATETTFAGMLFGGAKFKVSETWLSIIPLTLFILFLRRRRKININKFIGKILEAIL